MSAQGRGNVLIRTHRARRIAVQVSCRLSEIHASPAPETLGHAPVSDWVALMSRTRVNVALNATGNRPASYDLPDFLGEPKRTGRKTRGAILE